MCKFYRLKCEEDCNSMHFWKLHGKRIGIDLGTESILVSVKSEGIVINEPAIIAIEKGSDDILAVGNEAKNMIGKTPDKIDALRPLEHAGIANLKATEMIVSDIINRLDKLHSVGRPEVLINVHAGITDLEKRAVLKLVSDTGARGAYLIEEPIAAAIGAGLEIDTPDATMIVDLGSGVTETAVISLGEIVTSDSIKVAGDDFDRAIIEFVKKNLNMEIGKNAAEKIKIELISTKPVVGKKMDIKGRDLISGFPKTDTITAFQVYDATRSLFDKIIQMIKMTIERTPPELVSDIYEKGIVITGGGAYIDKIDVYLKENLRIPVRIAEKPLECVALGISAVIEDDEKFKKYRSSRGIKFN